MSLRNIKNKPFYKLFFGLLIANFLLHAVNMNVQAVKSAEFKKYENQIASLQDDVSNLNFKINSASSLAAIEEKAKKLGFNEINAEVKVISTTYALNLTHEN